MKIMDRLKSRFALACISGLVLALNLACQSSTRQEEAKTAEETDAAAPQEGTPAHEAPTQTAQQHTAPTHTSPSHEGAPGRTASGDQTSGGGQSGEGAAAKPTAEAYVMVSVPEGKNITVALNDAISTKTSAVGDTFTATVVRDVQTREHPDVIIPAGSIVTGQIVEVQKAKQLKGQAKLVVKFDELRLPSGKVVNIIASLGAEGKDTTKRSVGAIAGGAAAGAVLGKIIGKDTKDAAIGAVAGAAIGTGVVLGLDNKDVDLPAGTDLILNVDQTVDVPVAKSGV